MNKKGIIFDLDGTLWNTSETIVPIWNEVLKTHSETDKQISVEEMNGYMGKTLDRIAELMLPDIEKDNAISILLECCSVEQKCLRQFGGKLYNRLAEVLDELKKDYRLFIVSNCQDGYVQSFLDYHEFNDVFDDFEMSGRTGKSKGENIKMIIERNNLDTAVYVGDTEGDKSASDEAEIPFVFAEYGFGDVIDCKYSIKEFYELPEVIKTIEELNGAIITDIWEKLYTEARRVQNDRVISPFIEAGSVAAAILTKGGNIYVGVCIDTASTLGMCAERNAIANMITNGEHQIDKVVAIVPDGSVGAPCGACREYMMQLDKDSGDIEILLDYESRETVTLKELLPEWWGTGRFEEEN